MNRLDKLSARWQQFAPREKFMLGTGAVLLMLVAIYLIVEPALLRRQQLITDVPRLREDLAWMQSQLAELEQLRGGDRSSGQVLSVALVEELLREMNIHDQVTELKPMQGQAVTIRFKQVVYSRLIEFLAGIRGRAAARISLASIRRIGDQAGHVEASLTLSPDAGP